MATIKDIANKVSLSPAIVSRVINNDKTARISSKKREEILKVKEELGYKTPFERQKDKKKMITGSLTIGLIEGYSSEGYVEDPFYYYLLNTLKKECAYRSINTISMFFVANQFTCSTEGKVDGLICIGRFTKEEEEKIITLSKNVVFIDSTITTKATSLLINASNYYADVLEYMYSFGHRKIAFLGTKSLSSFVLPMNFRQDAYELFMKTKGLSFKDSEYIGRDASYQEGTRLARELLKNKDNLPTAVICANDIYAEAFIDEAKSCGINVPKDMSVAGLYGVPLKDKGFDLATGIVPASHLANLAIEEIIKDQTAAILYHDFIVVNPLFHKGDTIGPAKN